MIRYNKGKERVDTITFISDYADGYSVRLKWYSNKFYYISVKHRASNEIFNQDLLSPAGVFYRIMQLSNLDIIKDDKHELYQIFALLHSRANLTYKQQQEQFKRVMDIVLAHDYRDVDIQEIKDYKLNQ